MTEKNENSATWHTSAIVALLIGIIVLSAAWIFLGQGGRAGGQADVPPVLLFDPDQMMRLMAQPGQFEDPIAGRAELMAAARQVAQDLSDRTGAVVLNSQAAIGVPAGIDVTEQILEEARIRLSASETTP